MVVHCFDHYGLHPLSSAPIDFTEWVADHQLEHCWMFDNANGKLSLVCIPLEALNLNYLVEAMDLQQSDPCKSLRSSFQGTQKQTTNVPLEFCRILSKKTFFRCTVFSCLNLSKSEGGRHCEASQPPKWVENHSLPLIVPLFKKVKKCLCWYIKSEGNQLGKHSGHMFLINWRSSTSTPLVIAKRIHSLNVSRFFIQGESHFKRLYLLVTV